MQSPSDEWLHLFTSNIRDLYIQDALSLLAAPSGLIYRFRYEDRYIADSLRDEWRAGAIAGKRVAVYFSVQHPQNFHAAAFVPLRMGTVTRSAAVGGVYTIEFALSGYIPLAQADPSNLARPVREFTEALKHELGTAFPDFYDPDNAGAPKRRSAAPGGSPLVLVDSEKKALFAISDDEAANFEHIVNFMRRCVSSTQPFFRIVRVTGPDGEMSLNDHGWLELSPEQTYEFELIHYNPDPVSGSASLRIECPESVKVLGPTALPINSRYDVLPVRVFVPARDDSAQGEIGVAADVPAGATVRIPISIKPTVKQTYLSPATALLGAVLIATPGAMGDGDTLLKASLIAVGSLAIAFSALNRVRRGLGS